MVKKNSVRTSKDVASSAGKALRKPSSGKQVRTLAGSTLVNSKKK